MSLRLDRIMVINVFLFFFRMPKKYSGETLAQAVGSVRRGHFTIAQASREYGVPRKTVSDHVKKPRMRTTTGPPRQLSDEDTRAFIDFALYCARQRFPLTSEASRAYI